MSGITPIIRTTTLFGYAELADSLGLDTDALLAQVGLNRVLLEDPDYPVTVDRVRALLECSAQTSGTESFGLRLGERRRLANLGTIGLVIREEPTGLAALRTLSKYLQLVIPSLYISIEEFDELIIIREELMFTQAAQVRQSIEMALAVMMGILRELLGRRWNAHSVYFSHRPPTDISFHRQAFQCPLHFNAEFNGIACAPVDLQRQLPNRDEQLSRFVQTGLDKSLNRSAISRVMAMRQIITALLPLGRCKMQDVATHLHISSRTLHRYLAEDNTSFSGLLQQARLDLVVQQLRDSDRSISDISQLLAFESTSAFGHWFQKAHGVSARAWRQSLRCGP